MRDTLPTLESYIDAIRELPLKKKYTREDLVKPQFLIDQEKNIEIYYAPHNEYQNVNARLLIVGITPGFEQMSMAYATARQSIEEGMDIPEIQYACKKEARFSGSLRKNLIMQLDAIGMQKYLGITESAELFGERDDLLHTTGLVACPVFVNGKNYTGHTPKLLKTPFLMKYASGNFVNEINRMADSDKIVIVPLGRAVEDVLLALAAEGKISEHQILKSFPHPSGANVNRLKELEKHKEEMKEFLIRFPK